MQIPTEADWRDHLLDLDVRSAYANFGGKDLKTAYKMFAENSLDCVEDLLFMPVVCFRYYFHAVVAYLLSPESKGDYDGADRFCSILNLRMKDIKASDFSLIDQIRQVLVRFRDNPEWYDDLENDCQDLKIDGQIFLKELDA